jgi:hypothetical protein
MKTGKLKKFETVAAPLIVADSPEELAALIADLLLIAERMPGTITLKPTDIKSGTITSEPTKYNSSDAEKMIPEKPTLYNSGDAEILDKKNLTKFDTKTDAKTDTKINSGDDTGTFSNEQLLILEQIQNAEQ